MPINDCQSCCQSTFKWYIVERGHLLAGSIECDDCHEQRVRRETREMFTPGPLAACERLEER